MTPREARVYFNAYRKKTEHEMRLADTTNFMLGRYFWMAINNPKKYPDKPLYATANLEEDQSGEMNEFDEAKINAMMSAFAVQTNQLPSTEPEPPQQGNTQATAHNKKQRS